jgi:serine/threonine protein kinase
MTELCICGQYQLENPLQQGSFSEIFLASHKENKTRYAVKVEKLSSTHLLQQECRVLRILEGFPGIPKVFNISKDRVNTYMVMELLGASLLDKFHSHGAFSLNLLSKTAASLLESFKSIHQAGYIHRDIKPENFLFGLEENSSQLFVIDFGLSRRFLKGDTHKTLKFGKKLVGTARFVSINTHQGLTQSRRDDLEALGYLFAFLGKGRLPWMHIRSASSSLQFQGILESKRCHSAKFICDGLPEVFEEFLEYSRNLGFEQAPDYDRFIGKFLEMVE